MTEYFGMDVQEEFPGQVQEFLWGIDPYYHRALVTGVHYLSIDQNEPVQDHYFTAIYGTIMEMEEVMAGKIRYFKDKYEIDKGLPFDISELEAKED